MSKYTLGIIVDSSSRLAPENDSERERMTLQVVLRGCNGVVLASDKCVERTGSVPPYRVTDPNSKIVVVSPELAYMFAGDDCAKEIGETVAKTIVQTPKPLPYDFIEIAANAALDAYKIKPENKFSDDYRKITWVQALGDKINIWCVACDRRNPRFEAVHAI